MSVEEITNEWKQLVRFDSPRALTMARNMIINLGAIYSTADKSTITNDISMRTEELKWAIKALLNVRTEPILSCEAKVLTNFMIKHVREHME